MIHLPKNSNSVPIHSPLPPFASVENTNEVISKHIGNQTVLVTIDIHFTDKNAREITQNVLYVPPNKKVIQFWNNVSVNK